MKTSCEVHYAGLVYLNQTNYKTIIVCYLPAMHSMSKWVRTCLNVLTSGNYRELKHQKDSIKSTGECRGKFHTRANASIIKSGFSCGLVSQDELVAHKQAVVSERAQLQLEVAEEEGRRRLEQVAVR